MAVRLQTATGRIKEYRTAYGVGSREGYHDSEHGGIISDYRKYVRIICDIRIWYVNQRTWIMEGFN